MTKLEQVGQDAGDKLKALWKEAIADIERGIVAATEEAQNQEKEAKFRVSFAVTINLDRNVVQHSLAFSTRHKLDAISTLPDVNQESLPFDTTDEEVK